MNTPPPMPLIRPVRDSSFGFGFLPRIGPLKNWIQGPLFELCENHDFTVCNTGFVKQYRIPKGYQFDKASVPPLAWSFGYTPDGLCTIPALEHDFLCDLHHGGSTWLREHLGEIPPAPPAAVIHKHFYLALQAWGTRGSKAKVMYKGVDWFGPGGKAWPGNWFKRAAALACLLTLPSCTLLEPANLRRVAVAGGVGYLTGGQTGAITAAAAEIQRTSAKNPRRVQP